MTNHKVPYKTGHDNLKSPDNSLFVNKIKHTFKAGDADLLIRAHIFSAEKSCSGNSMGYMAADLLLKQDADAVTIACALLAPLLWQNPANLIDVRKHFGQDIVTVLKYLRKSFFSPAKTRSRKKWHIQALLASMDGDSRKALLFSAFRLLALENAAVSGESAARAMARETLDIFVPIANRLSLGDLRRRLEDACFRILDPEGYAYLKKQVAPILAEDDKCLEILLGGVNHLLKNNGISGRIQGRTKSLHGIHRKMALTGKTLEGIMDRVGLRIIVASVPECYTVLGLLHTHFKPIPGTFDDYIGLPKENGYQSLHTCVYPVREIFHKPIEFQVRTELMHMEAEHGTAAHWRYKNGGAVAQCDHQRKQWMKGLVRQHEESASTEAFIDMLHRQVFRDHLVVFGNRGRIVRLPDKATVRDYLKITNIHVFKGAAVKVNGKAAAMDCCLRDGDSIEVPGGAPLAGSAKRDNRFPTN